MNQPTATIRPAEATRPELIEFLKAHDAYTGHSRDSVDQLRDVAREVLYGAEATPEPEPTPEPEAEPQPADDPKERVRLAKAEHKVLQAWIKKGEKPPRPATPNLDAVNAEYKAGVTAKERRQAAKGSTTRTTTRSHRNPRYAEAMAAKKAGPRGAGTKVSDDELDAYVAKVLQADPEAERNEELEVAYWLEKLAMSRPRWVAAWERVTAQRSA
jgi:hypothetical protein